MKILYSACLFGLNCRYDGKSNASKAPKKLFLQYDEWDMIPVCPEQLGGLSTPRSGSRIVGGTGEDVLDDKARVITDEGTDVTNQYVNGAYQTLYIVRKYGINKAIFKQKSPSCGCGYTQGGYDKRETMIGNGVTTALLKRKGIEVITEENF